MKRINFRAALRLGSKSAIRFIRFTEGDSFHQGVREGETKRMTPEHPRVWQNVVRILSMIRFSHTLFALPFALIGAVLAWQGKGDATKAKEFAGRAANANILPLVTYAFVREKAKRIG